MKLYYSKGACSLAVRIVIHEIGTPCEFESVNLQTKKTEKDADFLAINSKGAVPTLVLDDGAVLTENSVIQQYLADKFHASELLPPLTDFKRYRVLEWLNYVSTELHKGFGPLFNAKVSETDKALFTEILKKKLSFVDQHLSRNKYLLHDLFTLPDAYLFVMLLWLRKFKIDLAEWPHLTRYYDDLKARRSIQQSTEEEGIRL